MPPHLILWPLFIVLVCSDTHTHIHRERQRQKQSQREREGEKEEGRGRGLPTFKGHHYITYFRTTFCFPKQMPTKHSWYCLKQSLARTNFAHVGGCHSLGVGCLILFHFPKTHCCPGCPWTCGLLANFPSVVPVITVVFVDVVLSGWGSPGAQQTAGDGGEQHPERGPGGGERGQTCGKDESLPGLASNCVVVSQWRFL